VKLINPFRLLVVLVLVMSLHSSAHAQSYVKVRKNLDCGSFTASAETVLTKPPSLFSHGLSQNIRIQRSNRSNSVEINLNQHKSRDTDLHNRPGLGSLAFIWRCISSSPEVDFLIVEFACVNESATTCMTAMDIPGANEWSAIYDLKERMILTTHHGISLMDERRVRALGIEPELWKSRGTDKTSFVYE